MNAESMIPNHNAVTDTTINAMLQLADDNLIMGHRCSEWCGHGPILEQDIALTNIALDFVGQARNFYQYAATILQQMPNEKALALVDFDMVPEQITEDSLACLRDAGAFKNHLLVELPNGDWAQTMLKIFFFSAYRFYLFQLLQKNTDTQLAGIAEKSIKEVQYHLKWSSEWVIRLGDGTDESKNRILKAMDTLWPYAGELFGPAKYELECYQLESIAFETLRVNWLEKVNQIFEMATLPAQSFTQWHQSGGKQGIHTEYLGYILAEMQFLPRTFPNATW
ncbi:1,2-phenylacetyl-CoA epoxidase subunit PaaC [Hydrotalea sp.]|uniref:1,2-phenylacetyl-CoA epoxidase subunit PaaC n=1 Tax=Hydrotalea sp. TaxID=2881279 RepID=UPI0026316BC5|nr:1,2-phenylacetyl-CoA epoxidase subunit PaaC [Hydrotalea sp.]